MKINLLVGMLLSSLAIAGCGSGDSQDATTDSDASAQAGNQRAVPVSEVKGAPAPPEFELPPGPPPQKRVIVRDLEIGKGAEIEWGDKFFANYVALDYRTGNTVETYWGKRAFQWFWDKDQLTDGWRIGLRGMRVGGRRELIVPAKLAYGAESGARAYLIELLKVD